jgi:hypothetical protein
MSFFGTCDCGCGPCAGSNINLDYRIKDYDSGLFTLPEEDVDCRRFPWDGTEWDGSDIRFQFDANEGGEHPFFYPDEGIIIAGQYKAQCAMHIGNVNYTCAVTLNIGYGPVGLGVDLWSGRCFIEPNITFTGGVFHRISGCSTTPDTIEIEVQPP